MPPEPLAYRLLPRAGADLEEIWLYTFQNWSIEQADRYHNAIISAFEELAAGTKTGRRADDVRAGYFRHASGSHIIFYRHLDTGIEIVRILHQRMDLPGRHL